jgi:hypothetical protein
MSLHHSPRIVTDNLVLCLDAGNSRSYPGSGTTWTDLSGNSNNATIYGGVTYSSANGGGLVFDGTTGYAQTGLFTTDLSGGYTVSVIVKYASPFNTSGLFTYNASPGYINFYCPVSGKMRWETYQSSAFYSSATITTNVFYNFVGTFAGVAVAGNTATSNLYINGVLDTSTTKASAASINSRVVIGTYSNQYMPGTVYCVHFYKKELTQTEIKQNFNALRGRFGL